MKKKLLVYHLYLVILSCILFSSCNTQGVTFKSVQVQAPFPMEPIKECIFPERDFSIVDYGAVEGGKQKTPKLLLKQLMHAIKLEAGVL